MELSALLTSNDTCQGFSNTILFLNSNSIYVPFCCRIFEYTVQMCLCLRCLLIGLIKNRMANREGGEIGGIFGEREEEEKDSRHAIMPERCQRDRRESDTQN